MKKLLKSVLVIVGIFNWIVILFIFFDQKNFLIQRYLEISWILSLIILLTNKKNKEKLNITYSMSKFIFNANMLYLLIYVLYKTDFLVFLQILMGIGR